MGELASGDGAATFRVGQRVCEAASPESRATVRFVGAVEGTAGPWVGVEWDDAARGRHDGSHGGVRYFQTASGQPKCASFVRPKKLSGGRGLGQAIRAR